MGARVSRNERSPLNRSEHDGVAMPPSVLLALSEILKRKVCQIDAPHTTLTSRTDVQRHLVSQHPSDLPPPYPTSRSGRSSSASDTIIRLRQAPIPTSGPSRTREARPQRDDMSSLVAQIAKELAKLEAKFMKHEEEVNAGQARMEKCVLGRVDGGMFFGG